MLAASSSRSAGSISITGMDKIENFSRDFLQSDASPQKELNIQSLIFSHGRDKRWGEILAYTYSNYDDHITIERVAKIANLTKESFCRYFKSRARKTYMEFLTELRIKKACYMIRYEDVPVKEIGYSCGFDSLSNFYDRFKKIMKLSPLEFRYLYDGE
ncbi:MAG: helix-turn-helix domain-containing protein [Agriterribacter sp.]